MRRENVTGPIIPWFITCFLGIESCKAPVDGINPATQIQTSTGNDTLHSEAWYHSIQTVATLNLSGTTGALIVFSIVFLIIIALYKKIIDYIQKVNQRIHNLADIFGVDGFVGHRPVVKDTTDSVL